MAILSIKSKDECKYDCVSLGEIMLRLDPGDGRVRTTREFKVWEGGGEYNVTRGLKKCFGMKTSLARHCLQPGYLPWARYRGL